MTGANVYDYGHQFDKHEINSGELDIILHAAGWDFIIVLQQKTFKSCHGLQTIGSILSLSSNP